MNNKPVAWWDGKEPSVLGLSYFKNDYCPIPLYTHPAKEYKEPSVKEIEDLWLDVVNNIPANDHRPREWHFARTILRKAQE